MIYDIAEKPSGFRLLAGIFGLIASVIGLIAVIALVVRPSFMLIFGQLKILMAPSTSLFFLVYGIIIFLNVQFPINREIRRISISINIAGTMVAMLLFILSYHGIYLDFERLGIPVEGFAVGVPTGHMSPLTAFCFMLSGLSFWGSYSKYSDKAAMKNIAFWSSGFLLLIYFALLLAYLYGNSVIFGTTFIPSAVTTGLAFLALGSALLISSVSRSRLYKEPDHIKKDLYVLILLFIILTEGIVTAGYFYYRNLEKKFRQGVESRLSTIADLKVKEIVHWKKERLGDAFVCYKNDNFSGLVKQYLEKPGDLDAQTQLMIWLNKIRGAYEYDSLLLMDAQGKVLISDPEISESAAIHLVNDISDVLKSGEIIFLDFHKDALDSPVFLALLVPIYEKQNAEFPLGVLVLRVNPETYLYPLIQSWPENSRSAETLLVRREEEDVLFLNELKFRKNTALKLRLSLGEKGNLPAAMAVSGKEGIIEGIDYRGMPVIASVRAVPDSSWFLVSKMDTSEVYAPLKEQLWIMVVLVGSLLAGTGIGMGMIWRRRQSRYFQERYETSEALRESQEKYHRIMETMHEGCQVVDFNWRCIFANDEIIRQSRIARDKLYNRDVRDIYPESSELFAVCKSCMDERITGSVENEIIYPDGDRAWFYASVQPVPEGIFILSMDITQRKLAENREKHLNSVIRAIRKVNQLITKEKNRDLLIKGACENLVATRGFKNAWIGLTGSSGKVVNWAESGLGDNIRHLKELFEQNRLPGCVEKALSEKELIVESVTSIDCKDCLLASVCVENSTYCIMLEHGEKIYGILAASVPNTLAFDQEEQALFRELGNDIAFGLYNIDQEEKRIQILRNLNYSEKRYRTLFEGAAEGIVISSIETKKILFANPAFCRILGYSHNELEELNVEEIHPKDDICVASGFKVWAKKEDRQGKNIPCLRKDGSIIFADFSTSVTLIDGIECKVAFVTDVTERKQFDDALKESEERFRTLFEYAPDAIYLHDLEGMFIDCNRAAENMTGYSKEEIIEKTAQELLLIPPEATEKAYEMLKKNARDLSAGPEELITNRKDGTQFAGEFRTFPLEIKGRKMVMGIARDITERKNLEEQLRQSQKLEAVGLLSGGIAHDFNNLLTTVIGNAELLLMDILKDNPLRKEVEEIRASGERAATLTRQLLAFSRKQVLQPTILNLNEIAINMEKMLRRMIGEDIELKTVLAPDLGLVEADEGQIEQVIMNLVVNSKDAMPDGGKITIETKNVDIDEDYAYAHVSAIPGSYIMMSISDTGTGIPKEIQDKIFEPFFTTKRRGKGTGLGLSTVYGIIKQSNGNIWVYSEPERGTSFKIYLPRVKKQEPEKDLIAEKEDIPTGLETILVVEDDEMVRDFVVKVLEAFGYNVLTAVNGQEAITVSEKYQGSIHLTLTDVVMPGISSREMEDALKALRPEIKVLYMSGYTDNTIVHHGVLDPGKEFIAKPFTPESLGRKIREVLGKNK